MRSTITHWLLSMLHLLFANLQARAQAVLQRQAHQLLSLEEGLPLMAGLVAGAQQLEQQAAQLQQASQGGQQEAAELRGEGCRLRQVAASFCQHAVKLASREQQG